MVWIPGSSFFAFSLEWPGVERFELLGVANSWDASVAVPYLLLGCDDSQRCVLLGSDDDVESGSVELYDVYPGVSFKDAVGLAHFGGPCVYGAGMRCRTYEGEWLQVIDEHIRVIDVSAGLVLDDTGRVYRLEWTSDGSRVEWIESSSGFRHLGDSVAFDDAGMLLYREGEDWLECHAGALLAADGYYRLYTDGTLVSRDWRYPRVECRTSFPLDGAPWVLSAPYSCGHSGNWLLMTPTSLWAANGELTCAIG